MSIWFVKKRVLRQLEQRVRDRQRASKVFVTKYPPRKVLMDAEGHIFASPSVSAALKRELTDDLYRGFLTRTMFELPNMTPWGKIIPGA